MRQFSTKKLILILLTIAAIAISSAGCSNNKRGNSDKAETTRDAMQKQEISLKVVVPSGVPAMSMIKMIYEKPEITDYTTVEYEIIEATDVLNSRLLAGEADIAVVPTNFAAQIYNKGIKYELAVPSVWGIFYMVGTEEFSGWESLKGKEIYTIGRGLTPDITTRFILKKHGIDPDNDVTLTYLSGATELAPNFISGKSKLSIMPEPMLSTVLSKKQDAVIIVDFQKEWAEATGLGDSYPQASLVVKKELADNHPEVVESFINEYKKSIEWLYTDPQKAGQYAEELKTGIAADIVPAALPRMNIKFVSSDEGRQAVEAYLQVLLDSSPEMIGGKLPDESFYYKK